MTVTQRTLPEGVLEVGGILGRIVEAKAKRLEEAKRRVPLDRLALAASDLISTRKPNSLASVLTRSDRINIIAEIKQRSPSKGVIRQDFNPVQIAKSYANAGAAALSVLAEQDFFGGSLEHITEVRRSVALPLLRKDFIFDDYQLYESVLAGADAVLLIVTILEDESMARLLVLAAELRLDALVEVHSAFEMERAVRLGASIFGVNNRDLATFEVDLGTSIDLARIAPTNAILVSESGINTGSDIQRLGAAGFNAFLVGEHLMRADDPGAALRQLIDDATPSRLE